MSRMKKTTETGAARMSRTMKKATETGLLICETISPEGLKFIEEWDPDLHYEITQELKKRDRTRRRKK